MAKRAPGYRLLRREVLPRVRRSPAARAIVRRVFAVDADAPTPFDVTPGTLIQGLGAENLPVVLILMIETEPSAIPGVIDEIARLQLLGAGFRPILVTDAPVFGTARQYGYPVELLVPRKDWHEYGDGTWEEYVRERLSLAFTTYRATATVTIAPEGFDALSYGVLSALQAASPDGVTR